MQISLPSNLSRIPQFSTIFLSDASPCPGEIKDTVPAGVQLTYQFQRVTQHCYPKYEKSASKYVKLVSK